MAGAIQPDLDLAASLFEGLSRATRRGRGRVSRYPLIAHTVTQVHYTVF